MCMRTGCCQGNSGPRCWKGLRHTIRARGFLPAFSPPNRTSLRAHIAAARELLPHVEVGANDLRRLVGAAMCAGATSHRADLFAVRCAKASAALMKRRSVEEEDLIVATRFVLSPRAAAAAPPAAGPRQVESDGESSAGERGEDMNFDAIDCRIPEELSDVRHGDIASAAGQPGRRRDSAAAAKSWERGQYIRAVAARPGARRIDVAATLSAAAPFQIRRGRGPPFASKSRTFALRSSGKKRAC